MCIRDSTHTHGEEGGRRLCGYVLTPSPYLLFCTHRAIRNVLNLVCLLTMLARQEVTICDWEDNKNPMTSFMSTILRIRYKPTYVWTLPSSSMCSWPHPERESAREWSHVNSSDIFFPLVLVDIAEDCGNRKRETIFLEGTREDHRQSDEHWNRFNGNVGETSERRTGGNMGFSERIDTILNWTALLGYRLSLSCGCRHVFVLTGEVSVYVSSQWAGWLIISLFSLTVTVLFLHCVL